MVPVDKPSCAMMAGDDHDPFVQEENIRRPPVPVTFAEDQTAKTWPVGPAARTGSVSDQPSEAFETSTEGTNEFPSNSRKTMWLSLGSLSPAAVEYARRSRSPRG